MLASSLRVLLIEDDEDFVELIRRSLDAPDELGLRFEIETAARLGDGLAKLREFRCDAALVDMSLPDADGLQAPLAVLRAAPDTPVLVWTNFGDEKTAVEAVRRGAQDFLVKTTSDLRLLKRSIRYAIERKSALAQRDQIIRAAVDGMAVVDGSGTVQFVNAAAEKILGAPAERLIGRLFPFPASVGVAAILTVAREGQPPALVDMRVTEVSWNGAPAALACLRDVTELRRVEQLKSELAEERRREEFKDQWIDTLSHDLRTPLTIIKCAISDLSTDPRDLSPEQRVIVEMARRQIERVERMVVKILDHSRLESGRACLAPEPLDAAALLARVIEDLRRAAAERALTVELECRTGLPPLSADRDLFEQLVVNLIDNALRFARARIVVRASVAGENFELAVRDDGVGIPPEKMGLLFTRFRQLAREKCPDGYKGTGLGLAICKQIVDLHGGRIAVGSGPDRGTEFVARLPLRRPLNVSPTPRPAPRPTPPPATAST